MSNSMNTQDSQSELRNAIEAYKRYPYGTKEFPHITGIELLEVVEAYVTTRVKEGRRAIELQAAANAYYEVADLLDELPHLYQKAMKKRQVALEEMTSLTTTTNGKIVDE